MTGALPFRWHPAMWGVLAAAALAYGVVTSRAPHRATGAQRRRFAAALVLTALAFGWPLGDLAAHVSLTALVLQRLVVMLAIAPLAMWAVPVSLAAAITRPPSLDAVAERLGRPLVSIVVVTAVGTVTLLPPVVAWGASAAAPLAVLGATTLAIGVVLWLAVLGTAPATRRLSLVAKGGYLMAASLVVTSLSFVWIFATRPLYPSMRGQEAVLGVTALFDQQLAGFVSKLGAYVPMWAAAFVLFARSGEGDPSARPLRFVDVERELERADRRARKAAPTSTGGAGDDGQPSLSE